MISEELQKKIDVLPLTVSDYLGSEAMVSVVTDLRNEYGFSQEQVRAMNDVIYAAFVRDIRIEDIRTGIETQVGVDSETAQAITVTLLKDIFYVVRDFFPGVDTEILHLGGELPQEQPMTISQQFTKREEEIEDMQRREEEAEVARLADTTITDSIEKLMAQFPEAGEMAIGSQKSILVKNMPVEMKPLIKYWIADYKEKMGYFKHTNLDRVQYVCHDKNTRSMNEEERRQLNLVLKSLDEDLSLPYSTKRQKIDFAQVVEE